MNERDRALREASVPTLLMCLAQITRDPRWLQAPFLPKRDVSIFAEPSGGLPPEVQQVIRDELARVLDELAAGTRTLPPLPTEEEMVEMMSVCLGERVPPEYAPMAMEEMGFRSRDLHWHGERPARASDFRVLVVGAGFSGIVAAHRLRQLGIPFEIVDKNADLGGTWYENTYPEAGVDTPNHFYSYSFAPNPRWTSNYSKQQENLEYMRRVARELGIAGLIRLRTEVRSMRWVDGEARWEVSLRTPDGERTERFNAVITATGALNIPKLAAIPGTDTFTGESWHSARWRHDVPLEGRRVAVIGTGASAMQFLRTVAEQAEHVTIFQRSPQWARPPQDYHGRVKPENFWLLEHVPYYYAWYRFGLLWRFGDGLLPSLRRDPHWPHPERSMNHANDRHREQLTRYLKEQLAGRDDLIAKALPDYPPYGKRILIDNHWYATLKRPNVELVTEAVDRIEGPDIVTASGARYQADVILQATGFEAGKVLSIDVRGRSGTPIHEAWAGDDPRAYLGITVPDYPNLFVMTGPNTALAHGGSLIFISECQVRYITGVLRAMLEQGLDTVEVRREVHDDYNARVDAEHAELVWSHGGMRNWYRNDKGRVFSPMPWRFVDYWRMTREPDMSDFVTGRVAETA